jgi:hypothetical protein
VPDFWLSGKFQALGELQLSRSDGCSYFTLAKRKKEKLVLGFALFVQMVASNRN